MFGSLFVRGISCNWNAVNTSDDYCAFLTSMLNRIRRKGSQYVGCFLGCRKVAYDGDSSDFGPIKSQTSLGYKNNGQDLVRTFCSLCSKMRQGLAVSDECYLVDPASSHMLVSKIKPCMCKYERIQTVKLRMAH